MVTLQQIPYVEFSGTMNFETKSDYLKWHDDLVKFLEKYDKVFSERLSGSKDSEPDLECKDILRAFAIEHAGFIVDPGSLCSTAYLECPLDSSKVTMVSLPLNDKAFNFIMDINKHFNMYTLDALSLLLMLSTKSLIVNKFLSPYIS